MNIKIRKAKKSDCERMMELVKELAIFERAPNEVTVTLEHFIETGFGKNPVWKALVAVDENEIIRYQPLVYAIFHLEGNSSLSGRSDRNEGIPGKGSRKKII